MYALPAPSIFFFFNDTATTEIYTLSLHDALPISHVLGAAPPGVLPQIADSHEEYDRSKRSEEHTSELQSRQYLVCRLLLQKNQNMLKTQPKIATKHKTRRHEWLSAAMRPLPMQQL